VPDASHEPAETSHRKHCGRAIRAKVDDAVTSRQRERRNYPEQVPSTGGAVENSHGECAALVMFVGLFSVGLGCSVSVNVFMRGNARCSVFMHMRVAMKYYFSRLRECPDPDSNQHYANERF